MKSEHEQEVKEIERALSENRQKLDKQMQEKLKILQRCEKLEAKVLLL